ncbi:MAG TPA: amidohydrolase family protein [Amycolatopsis sp.]|nr:amidohydrolase family protein [Amycolatopsis sp.]
MTQVPTSVLDGPGKATSGVGRRTIDTDVHWYIHGGMPALLPYMPSSWRRVFEMRGTPFGGEAPPPSKFDFPSGSRLRRDAMPPRGGLPGSDAEFARADLLDRFDMGAVILSSLEARQQGQGYCGTDASPVLCAALNDYAIEHWLDVDSRYRLAMCVSSVDPDAAAAEIRPIGQHDGIAAVYVPVLNIPLGNRHYRPIFAAAQDAQLPIFLHITALEFSYQGTPQYSVGWVDNFSERRVAYGLLGPAILNSLVFSGVFERFPHLNFTFAEFGFTWAPSVMWRMDATWRYARAGTPWVRKPPSEYVRERVKFGTQPVDDPNDVEQLNQIIAMLGPECLMFSTDYPHWDGDTPGTVLTTLPEATKKLVFHDNAEGMFRW